MEKLNKDVLVLLALKLDYSDIINFCKSSRKFDLKVCQNNNFWREKFFQKYPGNFNSKNFRQLYELFEQPVSVEPDFTNTPVRLNNEMKTFLLNVDFGDYKGIPINHIINPILSLGILPRFLYRKLVTQYLSKEGISGNTYRTTEKMEKYLPKLIESYREWQKLRQIETELFRIIRFLKLGTDRKILQIPNSIEPLNFKTYQILKDL